MDPKHKIPYRLYREHCTLTEDGYIKNLSFLGRDLEKVMILDNSPVSYLLQPENALPIISWFNDPEDQELLYIIPILTKLATANNVKEQLFILFNPHENNTEKLIFAKPNAINDIHFFKQFPFKHMNAKRHSYSQHSSPIKQSLFLYQKTRIANIIESVLVNSPLIKHSPARWHSVYNTPDAHHYNIITALQPKTANTSNKLAWPSQVELSKAKYTAKHMKKYPESTPTK